VRASGIGDDIFGEPAGSGGKDAIAGLEAFDLRADGFDFAGAFETEPRAAAANGRKQIGAVEA
jgi:hypothetical protein